MLRGAVTAGVDRSADSLERRQQNGVFEGTLAIRGATFIHARRHPRLLLQAAQRLQ
jgi:hypothetical protein